MVMQKYKNLTQGELEIADHYFETGNNTGLVKMQKLSAEREGKKIHTNEATILNDHIIKNDVI